MSKRPNVQSARERAVERDTQRARQARDARLSAERGRRRTATTPEPTITCVGRGPVGGSIPPAVQAWIDREAADQLRRYGRIAAEMETLAPARERWVREFYERITGPRGFSVHAGQRRTIAAGELPERPRRPWRVVW